MAAEITSLDSYVADICERKPKGDWLFRGVSDKSYELVPKIGRNEQFIPNEQRMVEDFIMYGVPYSAYLSHRNSDPDNSIDFGTLALAQHHGLPTRLLDWTTNPVVALYFACAGNPIADGRVYIAEQSQFNDQVEDSPLDAQHVFVYRPAHVTPRITAQEGLFTVHPAQLLDVNLLDIEDEHGSPYEFEALDVPAERKQSLLADLDTIGINEESLFPDLDGLAHYLEWKYDPHPTLTRGAVHA